MDRELTVTVPGGSITAWQEGVGPAVLLLHGGPGMSEYTESLAAELTDGYTVVRYQQRGVAPSMTDGPFDVETHMADAVAVLDAASIEQAYLLGHSWGGHLALHLAVAHPDRFAGLVPIDPLGALGDGGLEEMGATMLERVGPDVAARVADIDAREEAGESVPGEAVEAFELMWPGYFASPDKVVPPPPVRLSSQCNNDTFASIFQHFDAGTLAHGLPHVAIPTTFVLGEGSPIRPSYNVATAELIPGAVCQIEDCGHVVWMECPGAVRRALDGIAARAR